MNKCKLIAGQEPKASLNKNIIEILFKHKKEVTQKLSDIRGLYNIEHVAINIINTLNDIVIFSSTPSVEYNLIIHELWKYDQSFFPVAFEDESFFWWDEGYATGYVSEIKNLKEAKHHFNVGLSLVRKMQEFQIVYSFATRNHEINVRSYYKDLVPNLFLLGDYGYKLISDIYEEYCSDHPLPFINGIQQPKEKSYLKLIINNIK